MLILALAACSGPPTSMLADYQGGLILYRTDDADQRVRLEIVGRSPCDAHALPGVSATLNGEPMALLSEGTGPDRRPQPAPPRCFGPVFEAPKPPPGDVALVIQHGATQWELQVRDAGQPKTLTPDGVVHGALQLRTTPASATWGGEHWPGWNGDSRWQGGPQGHADLRHGTFQPGVASIPEAAAAGAQGVYLDGRAELAVSGCPAQMVCLATERAVAHVALP